LQRLTNGPGFYPNPCLGTQTDWAKSHHVYTAVYAMTTYPTPAQVATYGLAGPYKGATWLPKLANTGYAQAQFNVASMRAAGLVSPIVWVDVESYRVAPWSKSKTGNKAVLDGVLRGYKAAGLKVGVYSNPYLWNGVVGSARYRLPEWRTAGPRPKATAQTRCTGPTFQGGRFSHNGRPRPWTTTSRAPDTALRLRWPRTSTSTDPHQPPCQPACQPARVTGDGLFTCGGKTIGAQRRSRRAGPP